MINVAVARMAARVRYLKKNYTWTLELQSTRRNVWYYASACICIERRAARGDMMEAVGGCFSESPVIAFFLIWQRMRHWECVKKPHCCFLKWRLMTRWKTASEWSSTWGTLHIWRAALSTAEETQLKLWAALDTNFPLSSPLPGWSTRWRTLSFPPAAAVLVLLVLHLWRGLMPALWASTSNSLTSYMSQPTGWSGHSSLPAILRTVQPRLIFNTEAKRVNGLECEYLCVCVCVCGGEEFMLPNNSHFSSASIAAPISACWMLD